MDPNEPGLEAGAGRLRRALAAQVQARSNLQAVRAERLARIRASAAVATAERAGAVSRANVLEPAADSVAGPAPLGPVLEEALEDPVAAATLPIAAPVDDAADGLRSPPVDANPEAARAPARMTLAAAEADPEVPAGDIDALERFLADLVGTIDRDDIETPQPARPGRTAVVPLDRRGAAGSLASPGPEPIALPTTTFIPAEPASDAGGLARLPGAGPGLVAALIRAGVPDLATLAGLGREALCDRLGPLGRLIDLDAWVAFARAETKAGA